MQIPAEIRAVEKKLEELLPNEEIYWRQRFRITWLHTGDRNTKYFYAKASSRRQRNIIKGI